ncbi:MAG TPA: Gfo/Idh/MocA family oxidoreductase [Pirellulales bacterium]
MTTRLTRRQFVQTSAALGTTLLAQSKAARPARAAGPNDEIRTAIIGIRNQGKEHIRYHSGLTGVRVTTLCDIDERLFSDRVDKVAGGPPKTETDLRRVLDDKNVDVVILTVPNHWHALATVWACQAGKDVYVEKPATWCLAEGPRMIAAAKKYNRIVQNGTHARANTGRQEAVKLLREGVIGDVHMARAIYYRPRTGIGIEPDTAVPAGVNYDMWLGPAAERPFNVNRFHYNWHWNWDYGGGEAANNGVHVLDASIQGLDKQTVFPTKIDSQGGRFVWHDQGETPNTQTANFCYDDGTMLVLEMRNLPSNDENRFGVGVTFYGSKGYLALNHNGGFETVVDGQPGPKGTGSGAHAELLANFYGAVRNRQAGDLLAPLEYGRTAAGLCHLANISYRLGRSIEFDAAGESFPHDEAAAAMLSRATYRSGFVLPDKV